MKSFRVSTIAFWYLVAGALFAVIVISLSGCFGGSSPSAPQSNVISLSGTVTAPSGTPVAFVQPSFFDRLVRLVESVAYAGVNGNPVQGARVVATNFADGKQVGTIASTNSNGIYTISRVPKGIDVVIIATKEVNVAGTKKQIRLSALIPNAGNQSSITPDIDAVSTIAAETWGKRRGEGIDILTEDVRSTYDAARKYADSHPSIDLTVGGSLIGENYGAGLQEGANADEVENSVPSTINPAVAPAKAIVQDLRDAGLTVKGTYEEQIKLQKENIEQKVAPYLTAVGDYLQAIHPYALNGNLFTLEPGEYTEEKVYTTYAANPEGAYKTGTWKVTMEKGLVKGLIGEYTVSSLYESPASGVSVPKSVTFKIIDPKNASLTFFGKLTMNYADMNMVIPDSPQQITISMPISGHLEFTLQDPKQVLLVNATTFKGDYSGEFNSDGSPKQVSFNGLFTSSAITASGKLDIKHEENSGGSISFDGTITTATAIIKGSLSIEHSIEQSSVKANAEFKDRKVTPTVLDGSFNLTISNANAFHFEQPISQNNWPMGIVEFDGSVKAPGHPEVEAEICIKTNEYQVFSSDVHYGHGASTLDGTITYNGGSGVATMAFKNQAKLVVSIDVSGLNQPGQAKATGTIKDSSSKLLAQITTDKGIIKVTYEDGSFETLF
ncbi:MAG: carboxypeptidase regulatory-like domain-containing protein [Firmicutes bacterium]|nr:carboxypeptidase regulatory-like domain-containing protein [Bacillota bacterium]